jgi:DNA polymerase elongation subunit (family B)
MKTNNQDEMSDYRRIAVVDIETVSLNPAEPKGAYEGLGLTGRIVCIGILFDDGHTVTEAPIAGVDERRLLERFWAMLGDSDVLVGHNILEFDLPFILQRSWIHGIKPSRAIDMKKYYTKDVRDTMQLWNNWTTRKGSTLDNLAAALACGAKNGHGMDVAQWWANRDVASIMKYCMQDVWLTYRVYCKLMYQEPRSLSALAGEPLAAA